MSGYGVCKRSLVVSSLLVSILMGLGGCAPSEDEKLGDAQFCLDEMPVSGINVAQRTSQVNECLSKIEGVQSKQASLIRCSSNFLIEGFGDPSRLIDAMTSLKNQQTGGTTAMMEFLAFKSQGASESETSTEDQTFAQSTLDYCGEAGNPGYVLISSFANMATVFGRIADENNIASIEQLLQNPQGAAALLNESDAVIGVTATAAYQTSCAEGSETNADLCNQLGDAMASGATPEEIGAALRAGFLTQ